MRSVKPGVRVVGVDDAPFSSSDQRTELVGVAMVAGSRIDGVGSSVVDIDGEDATEKCEEAVSRAATGEPPAAVFTDGITYGGLTPVDIEELSSQLGCPVVAVNREGPDREAMRTAFAALDDAVDREAVMDRAGPIEQVSMEEGTVFIQWTGCDKETAAEFVKRTKKASDLPEPLRVADMIASGVCGGDRVFVR